MEKISMWSRKIVISVILTTVIEMILPENKSKKYIKIMFGIFIVYTIISPVFNFFSNTSVDSLIDKGEAVIEASSSNIENIDDNQDYTDKAVRNLYSQSLEKELSNVLQNNGYIPEKIELEIASDDTYNINHIKIKVKEKIENKNNESKNAQSIVETVKQIVINKEKNEECNNEVINENDKSNIKNIIHSNFGVNVENIIIN